MKTELITSWTVATFESKDYYIVNTTSGASIWVPKDKFDSNAETITYEHLEVGAEYTRKDGSIAKRTKAGNNFKGCGKQVMKKFASQEDMLTFMAEKGMKVSLS